MNAPISVVIPTFNRAAWLRECLDSVARQTVRPREVIVIDDGSTDHTESICRRVLPEINYIHQLHQGVSAARNRGIREARSKWIAFLDSDDLWKSQKLATQWDFLQKNPQSKIVQTEEVWLRQGKRVNPRTVHQKHSGWIFEKVIPLCLISPSAVMIHREVFARVGLFDESLPACEDYDLWLRVALHFEIHTLPEALTIKRGGHDDQLSQQWGLDRYRIRALEKILQTGTLTMQQRELISRDICRRSKILLQGYRKRGEDKQVSYYQDLLTTYRS